MLARLADRFILAPTTHAIPAPGKQRRWVPLENGRSDVRVEVWTHGNGLHSNGHSDLFILKFHGLAGRAERATDHPLNYWGDLRAQLWSVNPPGYGGSGGVASLQNLAATGRAVYDEVRRIAGRRRIVVMGNSLGTAVALHLANIRDVAGLILRNAPPMRQIIVGQHGWWNLWLGAMLIARQVPDELDSIRNAAGSRVPALFVMSGKDRTTPPEYQRMVIDAYAGPKRVLVLKNAGHTTSPKPAEQVEYRRFLAWLRGRVFAQERRDKVITDPEPNDTAG